MLSGQKFRGWLSPCCLKIGGSSRSINTLAEAINGLYKAEVIHRREPWRSSEAVEFATLEWVDWFNYRRLLAPIAIVPLDVV